MEYNTGVLACMTFVFAFVDTSFAFSVYQRFHVPKWTDNTMVIYGNLVIILIQAVKHFRRVSVEMFVHTA